MVKTRKPVVAILTVRQATSKRRPFAAQTSMLTGFIRYGRELGMSVYVITPEGVRSGQGLVGWQLDGKRWRKKRLESTPNVIYDRVPTRRLEQTKSVREAKALLRNQLETVYIGMDFFDKWHVHEAWADDPRIASHIPETLDYRGIATIQEILQRHSIVYVKPRSNSLGLGIVRLAGTEKGPWRFSWRDPHGRRHDLLVKDEQQLERLMDQFTRGRPYLVQQGIKMIPYNGRLFDIRAAVQRDIQGKWGVTGMAVRLGFARSIVTNMAAGAVAYPLQPVIENVASKLGRSADELKMEIERVALKAAEVLGDAYGYALGEVGLDVALAQDGSIWLFEANSKPLRTVFQKLSNQAVAENCLRKPMEYACYLASSLSPAKAIEK